jgi:2,3-bisphosphoglycerate-independent phosphoglycerate mutase
MGPYTELAPVAFPAPLIKENLADTLAHHNIGQLHLAETEKYAHVTYFLNSQIEDSKALEDRDMVKSPKCPSYADQPEMSARALTDLLITNLKKDDAYPFVVINYANTDLVGHAGEFDAAVTACKTIDHCLERVIPIALEAGYTTLITADHGNAEQMLYENGDPCPSHTTNPVPFILVSPQPQTLKQGKGLQDVAPTVLDLLNLPKPDLMTGESLINSPS